MAVAKLPRIGDYKQAERVLGTRDTRRLAGNTYLIRRADAIVVRYHATDIVTYHADGSAVLNSGGWRTATTLGRMDQLLPSGLRLIQRDFVWYVCTSFHDDTRLRSEYFDGMRVGPGARIEGLVRKTQRRELQQESELSHA